MHVVDGALSNDVVATGAVLAAGGIGLGLKSLTLEKIPAAGMLSATFFVASLVHVPIGPSSVHLIMNGLAGLVLGWAAFPALFVALVLQAAFFGFGGVMVLGVNTLAISLPAVIVGLLCRKGAASPDLRLAALHGAIAGAGAVALTALVVALCLWASGKEFLPAAQLVVLAHVPVMVVEALVCAAAVVLVRRVNPGLFGALAPRAAQA
jgi:cobalt/nickel transport system permease protein